MENFFSPFIGIYSGIVFTAALAIILESLPFISSKAGNAIGLTTLFILFFVNYSVSDFKNPLRRIFDYSNYRWIMDSINHAVIPIIGHGVQETGILVPGGLFLGSKGGQELFFHGLFWRSRYFIDKIGLIAISIAMIMFAVISLETAEQRKCLSLGNLQKKEKAGGKTIY